MKKNSCTPINPKKYSCYDLKKIPAARKFPCRPHNVSNGPSLKDRQAHGKNVTSSRDFLELLWLYALSWHGCGFQFVRRGGPSKEKQAGTRNMICLLYLAGIFLNPSTLFPVLALFFTRESCLTPEIQAHNRKTSLQKLAAMREKG